MRLIDADALKENMGEPPLNWNNSPEEIQEMFDWNNFTQLIDGAPTIEAEPVRHGHWEMKEDPYMFFSEIPTCSVCGCIPKMRNKTAYCSNCGAKMDEVSE